MKNILICTFMVILFGSCKNDQSSTSSNYLIFGHYYGKCVGEQCIEIFKVDDKQLLEDTKDKYPASDNFYEGIYTILPASKFDIAKNLIQEFPKDLLSESKVLGQPDYADGGGLYIEYHMNGVRKSWLIDQQKSNIATKYHNFIDRVNETIGKVQ